MSNRTPSLERSRVRTLVGPVVAAAGYDLEQVTVSQAGRRRLVRLVLDRDGGVLLDDIAELSRSVSAALDEADTTAPVLDGSYVLELSSPGVDRPLTEPRHWQRAVGRLVRVRAGDRRVDGRVVEATADGAVLEVDGARRAFAFAELGHATVLLEFGRKEVDES